MKKGVSRKAKSKIFNYNFFSKNRKGQVWIETVIYTLIAMIMIGAVLSWGKPKIEELQDKSIIEQTISIFADIDSQILSIVEGGAGNKRVVEIGLKKGSIKIDAADDVLSFEIETKHTYSEPGQDIEVGRVIARTLKKGEYNKVTLLTNYNGVYDIRFDGQEQLKTITKSSTPYKLLVSNTGEENGGYLVIDMSLN